MGKHKKHRNQSHRSKPQTNNNNNKDDTNNVENTNDNNVSDGETTNVPVQQTTVNNIVNTTQQNSGSTSNNNTSNSGNSAVNSSNNNTTITKNIDTTVTSVSSNTLVNETPNVYNDITATQIEQSNTKLQPTVTNNDNKDTNTVNNKANNVDSNNKPPNNTVTKPSQPVADRNKSDNTETRNKSTTLADAISTKKSIIESEALATVVSNDGTSAGDIQVNAQLTHTLPNEIQPSANKAHTTTEHVTPPESGAIDSIQPTMHTVTNNLAVQTRQRTPTNADIKQQALFNAAAAGITKPVNILRSYSIDIDKEVDQVKQQSQQAEKSTESNILTENDTASTTPTSSQPLNITTQQSNTPLHIFGLSISKQRYIATLLMYALNGTTTMFATKHILSILTQTKHGDISILKGTARQRIVYIIMIFTIYPILLRLYGQLLGISDVANKTVQRIYGPVINKYKQLTQ